MKSADPQQEILELKAELYDLSKLFEMQEEANQQLVHNLLTSVALKIADEREACAMVALGYSPGGTVVADAIRRRIPKLGDVLGNIQKLADDPGTRDPR